MSLRGGDCNKNPGTVKLANPTNISRMAMISGVTDHGLAARLATEAGRLLLAVRDEFAHADASERKAAGDKRSHDFLMEALINERPDDAVLSEEGVDDPVRLRSERVWIVDPLDGTREFSEFGRSDWAVHVALWQAGELVAGAVALPAQGITLATPRVDAPPAEAGKALLARLDRVLGK